MSFTGPAGRYALGDPLPDVIEGPYARAFRPDMAKLEAKRGPEDGPTAGIALWWVEAIPPNRFHRFINSWGVSVIHLRDLPGQTRAPTLHFAGAQYEFMILARNPDIAKPLTVDDTIGGYLTPPNVVKQFSFGRWRDEAERDRRAAIICDGAVAATVFLGHTPEDDAGIYIGESRELLAAGKIAGYIDLGVRAWWEALVDQTVEHMMTGGHAHGAHS